MKKVSVIGSGSWGVALAMVLNKNGHKVGLIEVHLYRPFSTKYLIDVLPEIVESIAVLDRTKEPGSNGEPLYLDITSALNDKNIKESTKLLIKSDINSWTKADVFKRNIAKHNNLKF